MELNKIYCEECEKTMKRMPDNFLDSIVTDPPYELGFMGKKWDNTGIAYNVEMWKECLRVLKPGGYLLSFGGTRTYHRMACAIEDAGFEIRDMIAWVYGSGFPKSLNIGKAVDKLQGNERKVVGKKLTGGIKRPAKALKSSDEYDETRTNNYTSGQTIIEDTKGTSEWEGWGTATKPAHEPICMARKPISEKTVAENCLKWGTGGINIDESRVGTGNEIPKGSGNGSKKSIYSQVSNSKGNGGNITTNGRFPANLIHDNSEEVRECFPETKSGKLKSDCYEKDRENDSMFAGGENFTHKGYDADSGNASRFFYCAKASKSERNKGLENNNHPTVKPIDLMKYLVKLITPPDGIVLDPYLGSGTTAIACKIERFNYIGIELNEEYCEIARARIKSWGNQQHLFKDQPNKGEA